MAFLAIELNISNLTINDLNQRVIGDGSNANSSMELLANLLQEMVQGRTVGTAQLTSKNVTSSITTSGTGSTQVTLNLN